MGKLFGYHTLGVLLKSLSDSCFRADEQEKRGEKVTACGMSSDEIEDLCENYLPYALNPMMSTEEVKEKLHVSDATLNRMVARGDIPNGECKKRGHSRYWKKWDILHYIKRKRGNHLPLFFVFNPFQSCKHWKDSTPLIWWFRNYYLSLQCFSSITYLSIAFPSKNAIFPLYYANSIGDFLSLLRLYLILPTITLNL